MKRRIATIRLSRARATIKIDLDVTGLLFVCLVDGCDDLFAAINKGCREFLDGNTKLESIYFLEDERI